VKDDLVRCVPGRVVDIQCVVAEFDPVAVLDLDDPSSGTGSGST